MPAELKIYRGLPGSGKTTIAESRAQAYGERLVGRDHIRKLLGVKGFVGSAKVENEVSELQERLILSGLRSGQTVHVDDMNLRERYVKRLIGLADLAEVEFYIVDLTYVSLDLCIERDSKRVKPVGAEFISDQHRRFVKGREYPLPVPDSVRFELSRVTPDLFVPVQGSTPAFLVDIDGTVALMNGRSPHDYDRVSEDLPNYPVIMAVRALISQGLFPVFVSGRPDWCREATNMWIQKHVMVGPRHLYMRETGDHRPDWLVKLEIFDNKIRTNFNVRLAVDDRDQVVRMYRELGLVVFQVAPGNF